MLKPNEPIDNSRNKAKQKIKLIVIRIKDLSKTWNIGIIRLVIIWNK